ncbi:O(6)-methylguanine-induced apoptosis 2-like isoform X1 [Mya arenaria]|uniref:O(6)-methylguanine-induced apoptosis 2-like isoform X1 n=1 Tax=Mya arenaria TaxID=6604 RepID=UPI0022DFBFE1|nr:O(6)-methylguanine-induced apoptosis 2-like isoform X1 [Mya arenaria]
MAATDSIRVVDEDYVKRIHSRNPSGHLHKGHGIVAATSSIPSRYQTIVTDNADRKGFGQQAKRFQPESHFTDAPGPGNYVGHVTVDNTSVSFSKKGSGGFASKTKRQTRYLMSNAPGPGIYALPSLLSTQKDFNKAGSTSNFHRPIAVPLDNDPRQIRPAPNAYDVLKNKHGKVNNVSADAAFKSQSKREVINIKEATNNPAPGQYNVNDMLLHDNVKIPFSCFKSTSKRQMATEPPNFPGPGAYKPNEPVDPAKKQLFPRKHYLCISAPAMPLPDSPPSPGPGSYELRDYEGPPRHYMSGAAFVSTTSRWQSNGNQIRVQDLPGPAHYRPVNMGKQSFIYNSAGKWI